MEKCIKDQLTNLRTGEVAKEGPTQKNTWFKVCPLEVTDDMRQKLELLHKKEPSDKVVGNKVTFNLDLETNELSHQNEK